MGLMEIGGICMVLYVMDAWIINLSDFHQECPSDGCPILHSHSIPSKILHIHTYTTPILILSMNLNSAECNFHAKTHVWSWNGKGCDHIERGIIHCHKRLPIQWGRKNHQKNGEGMTNTYKYYVESTKGMTECTMWTCLVTAAASVFNIPVPPPSISRSVLI